MTTTFDKKETSITHTYIFNENQPGENSSPYLFTLIKGMPHIFPNGSNFPLDAPKIFWDFFNQSVAVETKNEHQIDEQIVVYPNPSNANMHVNINLKNSASHYQLRMLNCLGQVGYHEEDKTETHFEINKNKIGLGMFILQIQFGREYISKKVLFE